MHKTSTGEFEKLGCKDPRVDKRDDKPRPGNLASSRIANEPSQRQQNVKQRVRYDQIPPQKIPHEEKIPAEDGEGNDGIPPQKITDSYIIQSDYKESDDRIRLEEIPDDNIIPSENQEGAERILSIYEIPYSETCLY